MAQELLLALHRYSVLARNGYSQAALEEADRVVAETSRMMNSPELVAELGERHSMREVATFASSLQTMLQSIVRANQLENRADAEVLSGYPSQPLDPRDPRD